MEKLVIDTTNAKAIEVSSNLFNNVGNTASGYILLQQLEIITLHLLKQIN